MNKLTFYIAVFAMILLSFILGINQGYSKNINDKFSCFHKGLEKEKVNLYEKVVKINISNPFSDSLDLVNFYNATNGPNWTNTWDLTQPMDTWYGVTLYGNGCVSQLNLSSNNLVGNIPNFSNISLTALILFDNQLTGNIPDFSSMPFLGALILDLNQLTGDIPDFSNLPNLGNLSLIGNDLSGTLPNFTGSTNLQSIGIAGNNIDSIPLFTNLSNLSHFWCFGNKLTFDDILPNINVASNIFNYAPQSKINTPMTNSQEVGESLTIDLGIDDNIPDNNYQWYKNGAPFGTPANNSQLHFSNLQLSDAGIYYCEVTNPSAPDLTLVSHDIVINLNQSTACPQDSLELINFFNATNGPNWTNTWDLTEPMESWYGVTLNEFGCVICLDFDGGTLFCGDDFGLGNNLSGSLPDLNLPYIVNLFLKNNNFSNSIPNFSGMPELINLGLSGNQLTGSIPDFSNLITDITQFEN